MILEFTELGCFDKQSKTAIHSERIIRVIPSENCTILRTDDGQIRVFELYEKVLEMWRGA